MSEPNLTGPGPTKLDLTGLSTKPSQVWGGIRLVPLVREKPITDLRLRRELFEDALLAVEPGDGTVYTSYIPHGMIADWSRDGVWRAAYGTQLHESHADLLDRERPLPSVPMRRLVQRAGPQRVRFLPLHLALEGYLSLHFGGPSVQWEEWSARALRRGLSPRSEMTFEGHEVVGLEEALRIFEILPGQCGMMVYAADAPAAAFVVPHPDDYRALHATLLQDLYGELVYQHAYFGRPVPEFTARIDGTGINSLAALRAAAVGQERAWARDHDEVMAGGLLDTSYDVRPLRRMGRYRLVRFLPPFERQREQHIGEAITDPSGRVAYLKTMRLTENQIRRGHLLSRLARNEWELESTAADLGATPAELIRRIEAAGFDGLLKRRIVEQVMLGDDVNRFTDGRRRG
ncbi:ARPP-2 domain-containing protein [Streptomyces sp. KLOTTS4A1]|uniref:ARPP-2 domain-containing protein n=1 Tax=Streptomyces sp. KLOTTS4A1 TaxID=3390996 RepID=UPI0039F52CC4